MNKYLLTLASFFLFYSLVAAQNADHVNRGALGFLKFGVGFSGAGDLEDDLSNTFSTGTNLSNASFQIGAGGLLMVSRRILLIAEGSGYFSGAEEVGMYSARLTGGHGVLKAGYSVFNNNKFLAFPYLGVGLGGSRLELTNDDEEDVFFGETKVPRFSDERLRTTYPLIDLGISLFKIPAPDTDGLSIGAHLGFQTSLGADTWKMDNDDDVIGASDFGSSILYLKLSIGGGGFFYKKKKVQDNP